MAQDIAAQLAADISESTGGGGKPFIRHGKYYEILITRCHAKEVKKEDTKMHRFAFVEGKVLRAEPYAPGVIPVSLQNKDDGTNPNPVGSYCSHSVDFDHPTAGMMAGQNVREFIAAFFGIAVDELSVEDGFRTWIDMCRKQDVKVGGVDFVDPRPMVGGQPNPMFGKPVPATRDKVANMACGYVIGLSTEAKENKSTRKVKDLPQEKREYFTKKNWICLARPGTGVNSAEAVAKRRAEVYLVEPPDADDDEDVNSSQTASTAAHSNGSQTPAPPAPPAPPQEATDWPPPAPWVVGGTDPKVGWLTSGWVWRPGLKQAISEADYRAGRRE